MNKFVSSIIQFILLIDVTQQSKTKQTLVAFKAIGSTIKNSMGNFSMKKNTIKNMVIGIKKQGPNLLRTSHNVGSKSIKYIREGAIHKYKVPQGIKPLVKRSAEQVRGKELGSLMNMVYKSKPQVPFLFTGGLMRLASFNILPDNNDIDLKNSNDDIDLKNSNDDIDLKNENNNVDLKNDDIDLKNNDIEMKEKNDEIETKDKNDEIETKDKNDEIETKDKNDKGQKKNKEYVYVEPLPESVASRNFDYSEPGPEPGSDEFLFNKFKRLEIRVGKIEEVWEHPHSEKFYCESVNIGYEKRQIISGFRRYIPIEDMKGKVLVAANLKPRRVVGIKNDGVIFAVQQRSRDNAPKALRLVKAEGKQKLGERVYLDGHQVPDEKLEWTPNSLMGKLVKHLRTDGEGFACFKNIRMRTKSGFLKATEINWGIIS